MQLDKIDVGFSKNNGMPDPLAHASTQINANFEKVKLLAQTGLDKKLVLLGDSLSRQAESHSDVGDDVDANYALRSFIHWFQYYTDYALEYYQGGVNNPVDISDDTPEGQIANRMTDHNLGLSGDTIGDIRARLHQAVAAKGAWYILHASTNDSAVSTPVDDFITDYDYVLSTLLNLGAKVLVVTNWLQTDATDAERRLQSAYNHHIKFTAMKTPNVYLVNAEGSLVDGASANGDPVADYLNDTIHLTSRGAEKIAADAVDDAMKGLVGPGNIHVIQNPIDLFHATENPYGYCHPNPMMQGTAGDASTNATGTVPDGWRVLTDDAALTVTCSIVDAPADKPWMSGKYLKIDAVSDGTGSASERIRLFKIGTATIDTNYKDGIFYGSCGLKIDPASSGSPLFLLPGLKLQDKETAGAADVTGIGLLPDKTMAFQVVTPLLEITDAANAANPGFYFQFNMTCDASIVGAQTFYIGQIGFKEFPFADRLQKPLPIVEA